MSCTLRPGVLATLGRTSSYWCQCSAPLPALRRLLHGSSSNHDAGRLHVRLTPLRRHGTLQAHSLRHYAASDTCWASAEAEGLIMVFPNTPLFSTRSHSRVSDRWKASRLFQKLKNREYHSSACWRGPSEQRAGGSNTGKSERHRSVGEKSGSANGKSSLAREASEKAREGLAAASAINKHVMDRLPHMPHLHRPNKEELLAAATGFWSRLKVRFKWFSIRSVRPFNMDEIGAFFSWFVLGHVIWIILGTTTFFSLAIFALNTVFAQGNHPSLSLGCRGGLTDFPRDLSEMGGKLPHKIVWC